MDKKLENQIIDKLTKTCTCRQISRSTIKKAIQNGCSTVEEINHATGAGSGACQGRNCGPRIQELLKK